jgi:hypothetical protein
MPSDRPDEGADPQRIADEEELAFPRVPYRDCEVTDESGEAISPPLSERVGDELDIAEGFAESERPDERIAFIDSGVTRSGPPPGDSGAHLSR